MGSDISTQESFLACHEGSVEHRNTNESSVPQVPRLYDPHPRLPVTETCVGREGSRERLVGEAMNEEAPSHYYVHHGTCSTDLGGSCRECKLQDAGVPRIGALYHPEGAMTQMRWNEVPQSFIGLVVVS